MLMCLESFCACVLVAPREPKHKRVSSLSPLLACAHIAPALAAPVAIRSQLHQDVVQSVAQKTAAAKEENDAGRPTAAIARWSQIWSEWSGHPPSVLEPTDAFGPPLVSTSYSHCSFLPSPLVVRVPQDGAWLHSISQIPALAWMLQTRDSKNATLALYSGKWLRPQIHPATLLPTIESVRVLWGHVCLFVPRVKTSAGEAAVTFHALRVWENIPKSWKLTPRFYIEPKAQSYKWYGA